MRLIDGDGPEILFNFAVLNQARRFFGWTSAFRAKSDQAERHLPHAARCLPQLFKFCSSLDHRMRVPTTSSGFNTWRTLTN